MESINNLNPVTAGPVQNSSKTFERSEEDDALNELVAKDPVLGKDMKTLFGKLDETNRKLDGLQGERQRNLDVGQGQVNQVLAAEVKVVEGDPNPTLALPPPVQAESDGDSGRKSAEECLGLPVILRWILEQFSDKELIKLSLVNKLWNFEARSVLRNRGCLKAKMTIEPTCESLVVFAADLEQMRVVPFTGIHVDMGHSYWGKLCESTANGSLDSSYQVILDRMRTKHLSVHFPYGWEGSKDCPLYVLTIRILENCCGALEELSISSVDGSDSTSSEEFIQTITQDYSFPCLKTLKYHDYNTPLRSAFAKALVSSAPNLEKFYVASRINFMENVMEGSTAELRVPQFDPMCEQVCESVLGALRAERIFMRIRSDMEALHRFVPMVLQASSTTINTVKNDLLLAVPLMCYGICMENVTEWWIFTSKATVDGFQPDVLRLLKGFDFTRVFPELEKVTIQDDRRRLSQSDAVNAFLERGNAMLRENFPDRNINMKQLHLKGFFVGRPPPLPLLGQMFPHVQTLSVEQAMEDFPFTYLWQHFGSLTELHVEFQESMSHIAGNFDSVFCGIFPKEVAELQAKDDDYLKAVNIVPVMPSITCLRGLRLFQLKYWSFGYNTTKSSTRFFSKVTGLIAFRRCPNLFVQLQAASVPDVLDHMKPYVTPVN